MVAKANYRRALIALAAIAIALGALPASAGQPAPLLDVTLKPETADGAVTAIAVRQIVARGPDADFTLVAPVVYPGAPGVADRMVGLAVSDATGPVPLTVAEDPPVPGGFPYYRRWTAGRAVTYPVTISYRAEVMPAGGRGGPSFGIRAVGGGVVGAGPGFLMLPRINQIGRIAVRWDLSGFPAGSLASTSFGDGDFAIEGAPGKLNGGWYLAGPAGSVPFRKGFGATWLGQPTFDAPRAMGIVARGYRYLGRTFPHLKPTPPYRVFMQFREQPPYGGATALDQSFMLSRGPLVPGEQPEMPLTTVFHEMIHQWVGGIEGPMGITSWFSEGLTSYYERELPMRGGFVSMDRYLRDVNRIAAAYETSKARNWSAARIAEVGFTDEEVRHTPYRRSEMYFHDLDARIRAASGGKRTLDSLVFPMFLAREKGERFDEAKWIAMVTAELGAQEEARWRELVIDGTATLEPRADSFGPCLRRVAGVRVHEGRRIEGFVWERVPGVPDATCRRN